MKRAGTTRRFFHGCQRLFETLAYSQIAMALSAVAFVKVCTRLMGRSLAWQWSLLAFVGCWWVYLLDAGLFSIPAEDQRNVPERAAFIWRNRLLLLSLAVLFLCIAIYAVFTGPGIGPGALLFLLILTAIAAAYSFPLTGVRKRRRLKEAAVVKPFLISAAWIAGAVGLNLIEGESLRASSVPIYVLILFLYLLLLGDSLMLDWRDRKGDRSAGIHTIPVRLGGTNTVLLLIVLGGSAAALWYSTIGSAELWKVGGLTMLLSYALPVLLLRRARKEALLFYYAVAGWRFLGAASLLIARR